MIYKHDFVKGGSIWIDLKPYGPANKVVPTLMFRFSDGYKMKTVGAPLMDEKIDIVPELTEALINYMAGRDVPDQEDSHVTVFEEEKREDNASKVKKQYLLKQKFCVYCAKAFHPDNTKQVSCGGENCHDESEVEEVNNA